MKKIYNSADLCTTIMRSEYTNSYDNFFYNSFVPIEANNNEEAIQSIKHIKKELSNNNTIKLEYGKIYKLSSVFELFYLHLLFLVSNNSNYIKKCKCCGKYFYTNKVNVTYCDRIQNEKSGQSCKDIGADIVALREKKKDYLINLKASIASKKAMDVKRHPDIPEYKENYKNWKPLALKYLQEYKSGTLDAKTFEKWLKYTSDEKIKSKLKTIDEFKD